MNILNKSLRKGEGVTEKSLNNIIEMLKILDLSHLKKVEIGVDRFFSNRIHA